MVFPVRSQTFEPDPTLETNYQQVLAGYAREKGIPEIDLLRAFTENRDDGLYLDGDNVHPDEIGYSVTAIEMMDQTACAGRALAATLINTKGRRLGFTL
jgi:lysophospholipase L1-like esterase